MSEKGHEIRHVDDSGDNFVHAFKDEKWAKEKLALTAHDMATEEKEMTIWKAIVSNKKAILWSLAVSTCVIMEGCKYHPPSQWPFTEELGCNPDHIRLTI